MVILSSPASDASEVHDSGKKFSTILTSSCATSEPDFLHCRLLKRRHGRLSLCQFKDRFPFRLDVHDFNRFSDLNMILYHHFVITPRPTHTNLLFPSTQPAQTSRHIRASNATPSHSHCSKHRTQPSSLHTKGFILDLVYPSINTYNRQSQGTYAPISNLQLHYPATIILSP
jgi:hypothetical protein